jgi:hypothetical protein
MKPMYFKNRVTGEQVICHDVKKDKHFIDGVEFLLVRRSLSTRPFLMRKDALLKIDNSKVV